MALKGSGSGSIIEKPKCGLWLETFTPVRRMKPDNKHERRRYERFELKVFGSMSSFTVALGKGYFMDCSLLNISQGGVKVRVNTSRKKLPEIIIGQTIEFRSFLDDRHTFLLGMKGVVIWVNMDDLEFGVAFDEELPAKDLNQYIGS